MFTGWHHTNVIVSDLDRSLDFYTRVLGLKVASQMEIDAPEFARGVGIPDTRVRAAVLEVPNATTLLEMFEYATIISKPISKDALPSDLGIQHICFRVDDIEAVYQNLVAQDVVFLSPPVTLGTDKGDTDAVRFCYYRDPDGSLLELLQLPT